MNYATPFLMLSCRFGAAVLSEPFGWRQLLGRLLILYGVYRATLAGTGG